MSEEGPFFIYAYVTRRRGNWQLDMHVENPGVESPTEPPYFGWNVPPIYVPVSEINDCKKVLGIVTEAKP